MAVAVVAAPEGRGGDCGGSEGGGEGSEGEGGDGYGKCGGGSGNPDTVQEQADSSNVGRKEVIVGVKGTAATMDRDAV